ncbi:MAG: pantetheine-phosphate adenylyltransferase [Candidatus Pacebacteria bacterium]|jgi:pantetheine-phosphate adenylyltransferase|nr:pantetheine-phosphate adenylyltransferase [Candidatus Paceibacterota bacterium]
MNLKKIAVYPGSFDPITNGHINIIERIAPLYDKLIVLIAVDSRKTYLFTPDERKDMIASSISHLPNVLIDVCIGTYVVKHAKSLEANVIIRGLRNSKDMEDEHVLAEENRKICPEIETIWIPCQPEFMYVSSGMVKGHVGLDPFWQQEVLRSAPSIVVQKLKEKFIFSKARKHWDSLMLSLLPLYDANEAEKVFYELTRRYSEWHRAYHTLEHIVAMLDECAFLGIRDSALLLAIWLHDVIYDPLSKDNEDQSATFAKRVIQKMGISGDIGNKVGYLILCTKHDGIPDNELALLLVDLDLIVLGKSEEEFDLYETRVRKEYESVPELVFREARSKILQSFLGRHSIYFTQVFIEKYESSARANLKRSLQKLQS